MEIEKDKVVRDLDQGAALSRAIEGVVQRQLEVSEARQKVQLDAAVDDIRSELRTLRRMDEALDHKDAAHADRLTILEKRMETIQALNQEAITASVRSAMAEYFSVWRLWGAVVAVLSFLALGLAIGSQL